MVPASTGARVADTKERKASGRIKAPNICKPRFNPTTKKTKTNPQAKKDIASRKVIIGTWPVDTIDIPKAALWTRNPAPATKTATRDRTSERWRRNARKRRVPPK
jgi:hypothetical protein